MCFFFFNDTATTEIYTLSLHDALPICKVGPAVRRGQHVQRGHRQRQRPVPALALPARGARRGRDEVRAGGREDRKSTRLNSSHANISYAVFCLKKKKNISHNIIY